MKFVALVLSAGLAAPLSAVAADYPTLDRVDAVLTCMQQNGGQNIDNLQRCSCEIDMLMQQVDYDTFTEARTYEIYKQMPGDKGGIFRDNPRAKELIDKLNAARAEAEKRCFVGGVRQKNVPVVPPKKIAAPQ